MGLFVPRPRLAVGSYAGGAGNGLLSDLLAYWAFDEASGNMLDSHSAGRTLTAQTEIGASTGKVYATARQFNNADSDWASRDDAVLEAVNEFTLALWEYPTNYGVAADYRFLVVTGNGYYSCNWKIFHTGGGDLVLRASSGGGVDEYFDWHTTYVPALNNWHSIIMWHDASADVIGCDVDNGTFLDTQAWAYDITTQSPFDFCVGRANSGGDSAYFDGRLGPMAIWSRVLTSVDRAAWYNGGLGLAYSGFEP